MNYLFCILLFYYNVVIINIKLSTILCESVCVWVCVWVCVCLFAFVCVDAHACHGARVCQRITPGVSLRLLPYLRQSLCCLSTVWARSVGLWAWNPPGSASHLPVGALGTCSMYLPLAWVLGIQTQTLWVSWQVHSLTESSSQPLLYLLDIVFIVAVLGLNSRPCAH